MAEPGPRWVWVVRSCLRSFPDSAREWRITRGEYLVASRRLGSSPGHQAEVYGDCEMFAGDDVEVGRPRIILGGIRARGGVVGCFYERPCALNAREAFTHAGRLAVLVLNHGRPVGADHRLHQLGEILAENLRGSGNLACFHLATAHAGGLVENKCRLLRNPVDHRRSVDRPRVTFTRVDLDVAINPG